MHRFVVQTIGRRRTPAVSFQVAIGTPAREIEKTARRTRASLIVMGTHGLRGSKRLFFGSTTRQVLRRASRPVLAVPRGVAHRPSRSWPGGRFLAGVELGTNARTDARAAAEFAGAFGATLLLAHVLPDFRAPSWLRVRHDAERTRRKAAAGAELKRIASALGPRIHADHSVLVGHPADALTSAASRLRIGLIVLVLRGGRGMFAPRPGSVTYEVLCEGLVPVAAVPARSG